MDVEPYQKYFKGKKPDLLGYTIIGIAAGLRSYFPKGLLEPPKEAFNRIASVCDSVDEKTFEEICLWAYKNFHGPNIRNINEAWFEIARLIQVRRSAIPDPKIEWISQQGNEEPEEEESDDKEFKARAPEHISTIQPRISVPSHETPKETKPELRLVKKPFNIKVAMRLCESWRLDPRWEKLFPCSRELFYRLIFRTYRKDTFRKIKQALSRGETYFPWCCTGIKSLEKQLTYQPGSSKKMKHYGERQIKKALRQLWDLGFIHRIFRGYEDKGAGKYHVFLNPRMSARFHKSAIDVKRGSTWKKRHFRMS